MHTLDMSKPPDIINLYRSVVETADFHDLRQILQSVNPTLTLRGLSKQRLQERLSVGLTTRHSAAMLRNVRASASIWGFPFKLTFFVSEMDKAAQSLLTQEGFSWESYPTNIAGNLGSIRAFIQQSGRDIVGDDDPAGGVPMIYVPAIENQCGVGRWKINPALFHDLWAFILEIGRLCGIPLIGMRGSEADSSCPKHTRCFCSLPNEPFRTNKVITSAQGFASSDNFHRLVGEEHPNEKVYQEYATACAIAVTRKQLVRSFGTLTLAFVRFQCLVDPPVAEVSVFLAKLKKTYSVLESASIQNKKVLVKFRDERHHTCWQKLAR